MKSIILLLLVNTFYLLQAQECFISGTIKGIGHDTISIFIYPCKTGEDCILESVICHSDSFYYHAKLNLPMVHMARIYKDSWQNDIPDNLPFKLYGKQIDFFISPGDSLMFNANVEDYGVLFDIFGSTLSEQQNAFLHDVSSLRNSYNCHGYRYAAAQERNDSVHLKDEILIINRLSDSIVQKSINYIITYPDWEYSANVLNEMPLDSCYLYYHKLGPNAKVSFFGKYVKDYLFAAKIGEIAPQFSLPDKNGKLVNLTDYKGKYVVLDFWGSWCGYCIGEIPELKNYYNKYNEKVEFIGIACKDNHNSWQKALGANEMNWTNLFSENEELTRIYGIQGYPSKLIISPEGIIIEKFIGPDPNFFAKLDELFEINNRSQELY